MINLATKYMGLNLKNPIIVSSCSLTQSPESIKRCADAGAGAIVLKSLFEEQIEADVDSLVAHSMPQLHAEEADYIREMGISANADRYLRSIELVKEKVSIPVIASLNCVTDTKWVDFAKYIEAVGADAIELNIALMPRHFDDDPAKIENKIYNIVSSVKHRVNLPIAVKIGPYFTSMPRVAQNIRKAGASGLVLFNRFYQTDIDINTFELLSKNKYSTPAEMSTTLRWIALLYQKVGCSLVATTGIHDSEGMIKQLLVGARAVEIASTLFMHGLDHIRVMLDGLQKWMIEKEFSSLDDFRGIMSQKYCEQPAYFERQQYIKALVGVE